jgi:hypothetical protein
MKIYEKIKMLKKGPFLVESFVIISSFDYDHTRKTTSTLTMYMP